MPKGGKGSTPQSSQFSQPMPQYGGNYMGNMGNMYGGGQMGMGGGRGGRRFGNVGIPNVGTPPAGKAGGFTNTSPLRMPERAPMPSLMDQYNSLNRGVMPFQPLGIRGYTPQVYPMSQPTYDPFDRGSYYKPRQEMSWIQPPTIPPQIPNIPAMPNIPNIPIGPIGGGGFDFWDNRPYVDFDPREALRNYMPPSREQQQLGQQQQMARPIGQEQAQMASGDFSPFQPMPAGENQGLQSLITKDILRNTNPDRSDPSFNPAKRRERPSMSYIEQQTAPMGLSSLPNYVEPVSGLTADTTSYQQQLPFISKIPETISRPEPAPIEPMPTPFGLGIDQQIIEDNPVLARRKRQRSALRAKRGGRSEGGLVKFQEGGVVDGGMQLEQEVIAAVMGQHPNPDEVFKRYIDAYGEEGLMELLAVIEQMIPSDGRMVEGAGDGLSDSVPAMIDGQQQAALSKDEYVIPADVVAHAGNGSSDAGGKKFDQLVSKVRQNRTGTPVQPEAIELEEVAQEVMV
jgi:hypothetical protein